VPNEEMFRAFNMGIGFALVVAPEGVALARTILEDSGLTVHELGRATDDPARTIHLRPRGLVGRDGRFARS
jgi:phosphoribosylaminoimidazole (AIR) synthetase